MSIVLNANLEIRAPYAIDSRNVFADITARDAFSDSSSYIFPGLVSYVLSNETLYLYTSTGVDNGWIEVGSNIEPGDIVHNDLSSLEGGSLTERYHTTKDQNDALEASTNPSTSNHYVTLGDLTIYGTTKVVADIAEMLLWTTANEGDRAVVTNNVANPIKNGEWIATTDNPTVEADWLLLPDQNSVTSVAGKTGAVSLYKVDITDLDDITVDGITHNVDGATPTDGMQWVYDSGDNEMKLTLLGSGGLSSPITSTTDIGGISAGDLFVIGTPLEDILSKLLMPSYLYAFIHNGFTSSYVETGTTVAISQFIWSSGGTPTGLTITDNVGIIGTVSVSNGSYLPSPALNYNYSDYTNVRWYLSGTNVDQTSISMTWVNPSYWNVYSSNVTTPPTTVPDEATITGGNKILSSTSSNVTFDIQNPNDEIFWMAVEAGQSGSYNYYKLTDLNKSTIGGLNDYTSQIRYVGDQTVNGKLYNIYISSYNSKVEDPVTLSTSLI